MKHFILILCVLMGPVAQAQESILDFRATVVVNSNRSVDVTEEITVRAEGYDIQRGIFRDVITTMINERGRKQWLNLEAYEVLKNGSPENFVVERVNNVTRIRIGNADVILEPGVYTYKIRYNLDRQVRFFDDYDEVYWNATGNEWMFSIEKATATIILPEGAVISQHAGYSGPTGATGCNCVSASDSPNSITYTMTDRLSPYEGLTVAVGCETGIITPPTAAELEAESYNDNRGIYYGVFGLLVIAAYLMYAWFRVGRDPLKGAIIPRYEPPNGFSPAACRYVLRMGFDNKAFTASIVNMALKGYLVIDKSGKHYVLKKISKDKTTLSPGEKAIASHLFAGRDTLTLSGSYISSLNTAVTKLGDRLKQDFLKINFSRNLGWMVPAILMGVVLMIVVMATVIDDEEILVPLMASFFVMIFAFVFAVVGITSFRRNSGFSKVFSLIPAVAVPAAIITTPLMFLPDTDSMTYLLMTAGPYMSIFLGTIILIVLFFYLIKAPTVFGRQRMDEIEGLKLFMEVAEKDRLNMMNAPDKTPQLFEKLLPYAIALDVENKWSKQFESIIERAMQNNEYRPTWYVGDSMSTFRVHAITSSLGSSFSSAVSSSSTPPSSSSSSGSSGGGSSGGGGGGGGGGGW